MQRIERYGVIALVFLLVTIMAVALWGHRDEQGLLAFIQESEAQAEEVTPPASSNQQAARPIRGGRTSPEHPPIANPVASTTPRAAHRGLARDPAPDALQDTRTALRTPPPSDNRTSATLPVQPVESRNNRGEDQRQAALRERQARLVAQGQGDERQSREARGSAPRQVATRPPSSIASGTYVVKKGDTLGHIAQRQLGTVQRLKDLEAANPGVRPERLLVGQVLILPAGTRTAQAPVAPQPRAQAATPVTGSSYEIRSGDTLGHIAQRQLGTCKRVKDILDLNPGLDPERLAVGATIRLPQSERRTGERDLRVAATTPPPTTSREIARATPASSNRGGGRVR